VAGLPVRAPPALAGLALPVALVALNATAATSSFFSPLAFTGSPWKILMARHWLPPSSALNAPSTSRSFAPWMKVTFTMLLKALQMQRMPLWLHVGVPIHFHSSVTSGTVARMMRRISAIVCPRQSG
jgi:hypothetical protein